MNTKISLINLESRVAPEAANRCMMFRNRRLGTEFRNGSMISLASPSGISLTATKI
jgi:hypothetical protein